MFPKNSIVSEFLEFELIKLYIILDIISLNYLFFDIKNCIFINNTS